MNVLKQDYAPLHTRYTKLSATTLYNGFIQVMLPSKPPDAWVDGVAFQSEWIHLSLPTRMAPKHAIGELVICHKKISSPNSSRIYIWYPIVANPEATEDESLDSFLYLYSKDWPLEDTMYMQDWLPTNPTFSAYGNQLFLSNLPVYVQSASLFRKLVWVTPTPLFNIVSNKPPVLYHGQMAPEQHVPSSQCGLEGLNLKKRIRKKRRELEAKRARRREKEKEEREKEKGEEEEEDKEKEEGEPDEDEARHSTVMGRLGALTDHVKMLTHYITYGTKETAATLGLTGEQLKQTADGVRQTSADVQTAKYKIQEMDQKVNEIQGIVRDLTDSKKIMVNADGSFSNITPIPALAPIGAGTPLAGTPLAGTPLAGTPLAGSAPTEQVVPLSGSVPNEQDASLSVATPLQEGLEVICRPEGDEEDIEMYNVPIGSSFASSLSENATVRMAGAIATMTIIFIVGLIVQTGLYKFIHSKFAGLVTPINPNTNSYAGGALLAIELFTIGGLLIGLMTASKDATEMSIIIALLFTFVIMGVYTVTVVLDDAQNNWQFVTPFFTFVLSLENDKEWLTFGTAITIITIIAALILSAIGIVDKRSGINIAKWVMFVVVMVLGYVNIGYNIQTFTFPPPP